MKRRDFLKTISSSLAIFTTNPISVFVPPRVPFVGFYGGKNGLYSHLGILPISDELNICEGSLLEIGNWDGTGFPCLIENICCFGFQKPKVWVYDFDLWNFRHDDNLGRDLINKKTTEFNSHAAWYAYRRFGKEYKTIAQEAGGWLGKN